MPVTSEARKQQKDCKLRAQIALRKLTSCGYSPHDISEALEERISWRTLYRWLNAEKNPKRKSDVIALEKLVNRLCK